MCVESCCRDNVARLSLCLPWQLGTERGTDPAFQLHAHHPPSDAVDMTTGTEACLLRPQGVFPPCDFRALGQPEPVSRSVDNPQRTAGSTDVEDVQFGHVLSNHGSNKHAPRGTGTRKDQDHTCEGRRRLRCPMSWPLGHVTSGSLLQVSCWSSPREPVSPSSCVWQ